MLKLAGQRFGRWHVVKRVKPRNHKSYWLCECDCGLQREVIGKSLTSGKSQGCGCARKEIMRARMTGSNHPRWKGGRRKDKNGYIHIRNPDYPARSRRHDVLEHRVIMSRVLRRPLESWEHVHHVNGIRDDNREKNLELWITSHPAGQRIEDLLVWSRWFLETYDG